MAAKQWEYKLVEMPRSNDLIRRRDLSPTENAEILLDSWGSDGWELCGIDYGCFIFKREKGED